MRIICAYINKNCTKMLNTNAHKQTDKHTLTDRRAHILTHSHSLYLGVVGLVLMEEEELLFLFNLALVRT